MFDVLAFLWAVKEACAGALTMYNSYQFVDQYLHPRAALPLLVRTESLQDLTRQETKPAPAEPAGVSDNEPIILIHVYQ